MSSCRIILYPEKKTVEVEQNRPLLGALTAQGIYIKSSCGGKGNCSDCLVKIVSGEDNLSPPTFEELKLLGNVFHLTKERLSCQTTCEGGDLVGVDIGAHDKSLHEKELLQKTKAIHQKKVKVRLKKKALPSEEKHKDEQKPEEKKSGGWGRPKDPGRR